MKNWEAENPPKRLGKRFGGGLEVDLRGSNVDFLDPEVRGFRHVQLRGQEVDFE